jgi:hypothetical protein
LAGIGYFYLRLHDPSIPSILIPRRENFSTGSRGSAHAANRGVAKTHRQEGARLSSLEVPR